LGNIWASRGLRLVGLVRGGAERAWRVVGRGKSKAPLTEIRVG